MRAHRLLLLGLGVTALLGVTGIASHGRPLAGGRGHGPTATFFDYVFTTIVLAALFLLVVAVVAFFSNRAPGFPPKRRRSRVISTLVGMGAALLLAALIFHTGFGRRLRDLEQRIRVQQQSQPATPVRASAGTRHVRIRWDEVAAIVALLGGAALLVYAGKRVERAPRQRRIGREGTVSLAFDESLDDLRADPDLRRAIIAAYARMERALAHVGLARAPSEAPLEYVERALRTLDAGAESIHRLTDLFEWAKFSQHEPKPQMRDEAIAALVAIRDDLREPARVPA
jgi:hypothetical protein